VVELARRMRTKSQEPQGEGWRQAVNVDEAIMISYKYLQQF
jgi:hypothetical protein